MNCPKDEPARARKKIEQQNAVIKGYETQLQTARDALSDATLRAPFDGVIAKRLVDNFANIQAKETIAVLQNWDTLDVMFDLPGPDVADLARRKATLETAVKLDSLPGKSFKAEMKEFSTERDPATQTYRARVSIKPPKGDAILPGMAGQVEIVDQAKESAQIVVPIEAVASEPDGKTFVWIISKPDDKVAKRLITTAGASGSSIIVSNGLKAGDRIAVAGLSSLKDNMRVRPVAKIGE